jgi:stalled ribosome alternative rescue factor ArfA
LLNLGAKAHQIPPPALKSLLALTLPQDRQEHGASPQKGSGAYEKRKDYLRSGIQMQHRFHSSPSREASGGSANNP